jgi:hypothetical protein
MFKIKFNEDKPEFDEMILYEKNGSWVDEGLLTKVLNGAKKSETVMTQEEAVHKHEIIVNNN